MSHERGERKVRSGNAGSSYMVQFLSGESSQVRQGLSEYFIEMVSENPTRDDEFEHELLLHCQ